MASSSVLTPRRNTENTFLGGFDMHVKRPILKEEFVEICNEITTELRELYPTTSIAVIPEDNIEGGFMFTGLPNDQYKSMRFQLLVYRWPAVIQETVMHEWKTSKDLLLPIYKFGTFMKTYRNGPAWTYDEIQTFVSVLARHDIKCTRVPSRARVNKLLIK